MRGGNSAPLNSVECEVVLKLVLLVGMHEETVINQEAQEHAVACALVARLLGQRAPAFIRLPVLNKNLHQPDIMPPKLEAFTT